MVAPHYAELIERITKQNVFSDFTEETCFAAHHTRLTACHSPFTAHAPSNLRSTSDFRATCAFTTGGLLTWHL